MFKAEITRGWRRLNLYAPDWRDHVASEMLNMANPTWCVVGQLGNHSWENGLRMVNLSPSDVSTLIAHGFMSDVVINETTSCGLHYQRTDYATLTSEWLDALEAGSPPLANSIELPEFYRA